MSETSFTSPTRPEIYNRPWHLDLDNRRHHGKRAWEREALEFLVALAGEVDDFYPPDWSDRDVVRFRVSGRSEPFAEVRTDSAKELVIQFALGSAAEARDGTQKFGLPLRRVPGTPFWKVAVRHFDLLKQGEFREIFILAAKAFSAAGRQ